MVKKTWHDPLLRQAFCEDIRRGRHDHELADIICHHADRRVLTAVAWRLIAMAAHDREHNHA